MQLAIDQQHREAMRDRPGLQRVDPRFHVRGCQRRGVRHQEPHRIGRHVDDVDGIVVRRIGEDQPEQGSVSEREPDIGGAGCVEPSRAAARRVERGVLRRAEHRQPGHGQRAHQRRFVGKVTIHRGRTDADVPRDLAQRQIIRGARRDQRQPRLDQCGAQVAMMIGRLSGC